MSEVIKIVNKSNLPNRMPEDRRFRLLDFVKSSEELIISEKARKNLVKEVSQMAIKVRIEVIAINPFMRKEDPDIMS